MTNPQLPLIDQRRIEANILRHVFDTLEKEVGRSEALKLMERSVALAAAEAGREFAARAGEGTSLEHFSTVIDQLVAGDNPLDVSEIKKEKTRFSYKVTRCGYFEMYRTMGLEADLCYRLSCIRDEAFIDAYSPHLTMKRSKTIAEGHPCCQFEYIWRD